MQTQVIDRGVQLKQLGGECAEESTQQRRIRLEAPISGKTGAAPKPKGKYCVGHPSSAILGFQGGVPKPSSHTHSHIQLQNERHPERFFQRQMIRYLLKTYKIIKPRFDFKVFCIVFNNHQNESTGYTRMCAMILNRVYKCIEYVQAYMKIIQFIKLIKFPKLII